MSRLIGRLRRTRGESGQALVLVVISAVVLIAFAGLAIDIARVWIAQQELQRAVDAASLAAGEKLPDSSVAYTTATNYAGTGSVGNTVGGWGISPSAPSVTFECDSHGPSGTYTSGSPPTCLTDTSGDKCNPSGSQTPTSPAGGGTPTTCNAVRVSESATVSMSLLNVLVPKITLTATSTATSKGTFGVPRPLNIFVIVDTTGSMEDSCSATITGISSPDKLDCAKEGVRTLLQDMPYTSVDGTPEADDDVGIVVFPALSTTLSSSQTPVTTQLGTFKGSISSTHYNRIVTGSTNESGTYASGDSIAGNGIPTGTTITGFGGSSGSYYVTISNNATSTEPSGTTFTVSTTTTTTTYSFPNSVPTTAVSGETDCNSNDSFGVTYPPYEPYDNTSGDTGGIPTADNYAGAPASYTSPGYVDNYEGYMAVPLSSDYLTNGSLNPTSSLVESVDWTNNCKNDAYPGGDYYGLKDVEDLNGVSGQGSYLAGAITAAQYYLATSSRTTGPTGATVTNAIIILSDGELNSIPKNGANSNGVDPETAGNQTATSDSPCEDALDAATAAKADGTLIFSIAYDDSGGSCDDSGNDVFGHKYTGSAETLMEDLATSSSYFADQSSAGDLGAAFTQAANQLTGASALIPECTQVRPSC